MNYADLSFFAQHMVCAYGRGHFGRVAEQIPSLGRPRRGRSAPPVEEDGSLSEGVDYAI